MALIQAETAHGFTSMPAIRQLIFMVVLAASVALGVAVVFWSQKPGYSLLYGNLTGTDNSMVLEALQKANIPYKVDDSSGAIMVPSGEVHKARLKLAAEGLPKGNGVGFELLNKEQDMGTSKFVEQARYQHAMEIELARSIMTMRSVRNARIHLAIPKRSVFVRKTEKPTASVVLDLMNGHRLDEGQIASIVHLVASSVPGLMPEQVTVVDQSGTLLSRVTRDNNMGLTTSQFEFSNKLENTYKSRIEELLSPIVGPGRVKAQVVADIDFTVTEKTRESYNPDLPALRSEQTITQSSTGSGTSTSGVPGSLSSQPPATGANAQQGQTGQNNASTGSSNKRITRNYELDKTISHTRFSAGRIRKISVAVLVDDLKSVGQNGQVTKTPLNQEAMSRITTLVKEAVGYDAGRGDSVNVINASFYEPGAPEPIPDPPFWKLPWVQDLAKQIVGVIVAIFGILSLMKVLRNLTDKGSSIKQMQLATEHGGHQGDMSEDQLTLTGGQASNKLPAPNAVDQQLNMARSMVQQDPARVAQVVKTWVSKDG